MRYYDKPKFMMKDNMQKSNSTGIFFHHLVSETNIREISNILTGTEECDVEFVNNEYADEFIPRGYNRGCLGFLFYKDNAHFITFSPKIVGGRNSVTQSIPTAYNLFSKNTYVKKTLNYYFLLKNATPLTLYHSFLFRICRTLDINFLNTPPNYSVGNAFISPEDIMHTRAVNKVKNKSNNSSYITKNEEGYYELFAKTYGASKYESSFLCYALSKILGDSQILKVYEIIEGNLEELPNSSKEIIERLGNVELIKTDRTMDIKSFGRPNFRSNLYISHLFDTLGDKHCAFCNCDIPDIIQGAHIWNVADIKREPTQNNEQKYAHATCGSNGIWLCQNHHKLFDNNLITINSRGSVLFANKMPQTYNAFLNEITTNRMIDSNILTDEFLFYLGKRNVLIGA